VREHAVAETALLSLAAWESSWMRTDEKLVLNAVSMRRRTSASRARPPPRRDSMAELVPESRAPPS
jgi:hypothetical protein